MRCGRTLVQHRVNIVGHVLNLNTRHGAIMALATPNLKLYPNRSGHHCPRPMSTFCRQSPGKRKVQQPRVSRRKDAPWVVAPDDELEALRMLTDRRSELGRLRVQTLNRLQRLLSELIPGQRKRDLSALQAKALLATVRPRYMTGKTRRRMSTEELADLVAVVAKLKIYTNNATAGVPRPQPNGSSRQGNCSKEEGTTTTPFDMVVQNDLDRFHLAMDVIDRVPGLARRAPVARQKMVDMRTRHRDYVVEHGIDMAEVLDWAWSR